MINNDVLNQIIGMAKNEGIDAKVRDVCFSILSQHIEDKVVVFRCLFDSESKMPESQAEYYIKSKKVKSLDKIVSSYIKTPVERIASKKNKEHSISFDENLAYMLNIKKETEDAMKNGEMDKKDALKILADITVKLNDKFNVNEDVKEQMVVVSAKYDHICPVCSTEVSRRPISKEEAMEMYGLIEKEKQNK
jgi:DNA repair exonuclease SbcCD ATPase subunit